MKRVKSSRILQTSLAKQQKRFVFIIILSILFIILAISLVVNNTQNSCIVQLNTGLDEKDPFLQHNYNLFLTKNNEVKGRLVETNGWLLLEANLEKTLGKPENSVLLRKLQEFEESNVIGWWPEDILKAGKQYFINKEPVQLYRDADDTAWVYRYYEKEIQDDIIKIFLSNESLPYNLNEICKAFNCNKELVIRVWDNPDWHDEIDIVATANFITTINRNTTLGKNVFDTNQQLLNSVIEQDKKLDTYFVFGPKAAVYFLLLFYNEQGPQFLTKKSRNILLDNFKVTSYQLNEHPLMAFWGDADELYYSCNIISVNEHIPKLMHEYAKNNWRI